MSDRQPSEVAPGVVLESHPPSAPIHRLSDIKELKVPYNEEKIAAFLQGHQVGRTGVAAFNECLFQSVLLTDFFKKIAASKIKPGEPAYDEPAQYLLKKSFDLLKPLGVKIHEARQRYNETLENSPDLRAKLEKERGFIDGMAERFQTLERNLLDALAEPGTFTPTRDKACFLLFAHAMLTDAANNVQRWMTDLAAAEPGAQLIPPPIFDGDDELLLSYLTDNKSRSNLFSAEPLTPADEELYEKGLFVLEGVDDGLRKRMLPSFSPTGSQGPLAQLHSIFHGNGLLTGVTGDPYPAHANDFKGSHLVTLRHDCFHVQMMYRSQVFSRIAPNLMPIYGKLENPASNLPADTVTKDLLVLFHMLHESMDILRTLNSRDPDMSYLHFARANLDTWLRVVDMVVLLSKVGISIPAVARKGPRKEKADHYEAVARAMNDLWQDFRQRHADDLKASGLFARVPKFLND